MTSRVHPGFRAHIDGLLDNTFPGNSPQKVAVRDLQCSAPAVFCEEKIFDQFKVLIPYAGYTLVWEVRFDTDCPDLAPDFLFDDDSFTHFLTIDIISARVPSLVNWDAGNPECLRSVIQELLNLYTVHQLQRLERDGSPIVDDCSKLMQEFELEEYQLQVLSGDTPTLPHYFPNSSRPNRGTVSVMILHLETKVTAEQIPEQYRQMILQFSFREYSANSVVLHISPALYHLLGSPDLEIPNFSKSDGLSQYFHSFIKIVNDSLSEVIESYNKRKAFHIGINSKLKNLEAVSVFPAECDIPHCTKSSYIMEMKEYPVTAVFQTPINGDPKVFVNSLSGKSQHIKVESAWDVDKTVQALLNFLMDFKDENGDSVL